MTRSALITRIVALVAITAVALTAFVAFGPTGQANAATRPVCTFATPIAETTPGSANTATCTIDVHGTTHVLVVDFVFSAPPVITGCTLDGVAIHVGPCP